MFLCAVKVHLGLGPGPARVCSNDINFSTIIVYHSILQDIIVFYGTLWYIIVYYRSWSRAPQACGQEPRSEPLRINQRLHKIVVATQHAVNILLKYDEKALSQLRSSCICKITKHVHRCNRHNARNKQRQSHESSYLCGRTSEDFQKLQPLLSKWTVCIVSQEIMWYRVKTEQKSIKRHGMALH